MVQRFWFWAICALSVLALFSGWIVALHRSVRAKSQAAAVLDQKVNERTVELRQAQADLSKALEHERELGELKSRFVSMVSHEFRTPLGVTMSAVEIIRQFDERLSFEKRRELCDEIHSSTCNMAGLMEQVLLLGRVDAGKLGVQPRPVNLDTLMRKLTDELLSSTSRKCALLWRPETDLEGAQADEAILRHILGNLIGNAVKYSPDAGEVIIQARRDGMDVVFEIIDHGMGIPEKDLPHLYDAFHRSGNVSDIAGTGLGLVIVKRCIELHRGLITVKSEVNRGTTFTVRLPVFEIPATHLPLN
jgi:signal transduction histidine kinase